MSRFRWIVGKVAAGVLLPLIAFLGAALVWGTSSAQDKDKKVIKTTTDSKGFERRLTEVDLMYQTAKQFMAAGQYENATQELEKVIAADPSRLDAVNDLATCYNQLKAPDKAAAAYERAVANHPHDMNLLSNLGYYQVLAKQYEKAVVTYESMLEHDSLSYDAHVHLGFLYQGLGDSKKAIRHYEKALEAKSDDVQTLGSLAKIYTDMGNDAKAIETMERAIRVAPAELKPRLKSQLGTAYIKMQNFEKSAEMFQSLVAEEKDKASNYFNLGISYMQLKRPGEAIPALEKAIELKPDEGVTYQYLANMFNETGQATKAIDVAQRGIAVNGSDKAALYCAWGKGLEKLQRYDEAISKFEQAVNDAQWGSYARKQIERQVQLKKIAQMKRENQG